MDTRRLTLALCAAGLLLAAAMAGPAQAAKRVALVIGNAEYKHASLLANPLNDAADIAAALGRLGFKVTRLDNADFDTMRRGLRNFTRAAAASEIAIVFYAGHGIEVDGRNFLIPVDARLASDQDVEYEAVPLDLVSRSVDRASELRLIVLDACRDNPFAKAMTRSGATRSIGRGLARFEPAGETLVAYAAKGGSVAADGEGRNSPYSTALLAHLEEPGLEVGLMFRKVRDAVLDTTGGRQEPFVYGSLSSKGFYLAARSAPGPGTLAPGGGAKVIVKGKEALFWLSVKDSRDPADIKAYLEKYPEGLFAALARNRLKRLTDPQAKTGDDPQAVEAALGLKRSERRRIQTALWANGFDPGDRGGLFFDRKTREAIGKWQASLGKASSGYLGVEGAKTLLGIAPDLSGGIWATAANAPCKLWNPGPQPGETVTWSGACEGGRASGEGRAVWKTGKGEAVYEGKYSSGRKHGKGLAIWANGRHYTGEWRNGQQHGQGTGTLADGTLYQGAWREGEPHGMGARIADDGTRYEGEWTNGRMPDRGVIIRLNGDRYKGEWPGRGIYTWPDGRRYEGEFRDGKAHGRGTKTWPNGDRREGEWQYGNFKTGRVVRSWSNGSSYNGGWRDGKAHGRGTMTWKSGSRYEGEWRDNEMHGHGTMTLPSGSRYEGEFRGNRYHGRGTFTWPSGNRYEGGWQNGKRHGRGSMTPKGGLPLRGTWRHGKYAGP